ncbi:hypothetical protein RhiJN_11970 [Ceratobasidium sp. AG-Ba]|nr:hypothetical protein RhiJN_11970 [Ceratobasidium sp. AG-Ba]
MAPSKPEGLRGGRHFCQLYTPRHGGSTEPLDSTARDSIRFQKCLESQCQAFLTPLTIVDQPAHHIELGFEETDAIVVHGANGGSVAEDSFMQGLDMLFFEVQDDDVLVLLVSMHAILESGSVYLAFERNDRSVARVGTRELVEKINAKLGDVCCTVEIVFDTCFAAGLIKCPHIIRQMAPNSANGPEVIKDEPLALRAKQAPNQLAAYNDLGVRIAEENPSSLGDRLCTPHLHTRSVIIVWAAAEINQRAYECKFDGSGGGALITAICEAVETHGIVSRQKVFDDSVHVMLDRLNHEDDTTISGSHPHNINTPPNTSRLQCAQLLGNYYNSERILSGNMFQRVSKPTDTTLRSTQTPT